MTSELLFLDLSSTPIFEQLQLEEALLRTADSNICLINRGSPRAIVLGISGKPELMLNLERVACDPIPIIQRFSGGGTVIVDEHTLFITFIMSTEALSIHPFPESILRWSGELYTKSWAIPNFHLIDNDYAIGALKCGGNAQYIKKNRWLHHTSFLWDYRNENMDYLALPAKQPQYRQNRPHDQFLCRLKDYATSPTDLINALKRTLAERFVLKPIQISDLTLSPHRRSVRWVYTEVNSKIGF